MSLRQETDRGQLQSSPDLSGHMSLRPGRAYVSLAQESLDESVLDWSEWIRGLPHAGASSTR